ncbi:response regulator transcription factor [Nocardioides houyundeii]|uniref:response regulator transcription factor n=1 Tax=Nocardioides houyundeii TaxID=2045452 RepID=UPI000DF2A677|nr:response regulator transcription factor [Nocardioides houyundeii]
MKLFRGQSADKSKSAVPEESVVEPTQPQPTLESLRYPGPMRVVIVDDDEEVRFVLRIALDAAEFEVVGDAGDAESAMALIGAEKPDIVLLDLHMPDIGGLEILPLIYEDSPFTKVVVCSAISATYMTEAALKEGAWGYIVKGVSAKSITEHLKQIGLTGAVRPIRPYPLGRDFASRDTTAESQLRS